ncbi:DUF3619 family protein [Xylophilus ampelinus]|uniref:Uncharacterized protein DUF3619 n=1 Tax=Xylophilus ampelinus TaxID=54067 RepID=A0A318SPI1_9BURK|nr:DUF3619 family protein [Xylophilus ampelinus]MCS4508752.1 DUF3619 family protein [Xylophilus ampelinus]PYE79322.1 uncharacterized protein DUF3619 [Xylophilus ampelinus]
MTQAHTSATLHLQDEFGERIAARLSEGARVVPHDISQRLRMLRQQAVAHRRVVNVRARTASSIFGQGHTATATASFGQDGPGLWGRIAAVLPLAALAAGLFTIYTVQEDNRVHELAEVDSALLADDLPPSAYADPGFLQFMKNSSDSPR